MTILNLTDCFQACFNVNLPAEAVFCLRNDSNLCVSNFGPRIVRSATFECFWTSQDFVIVGDEAASQYHLVGAVTAHRSQTHLFVHRHQGRFTSITVFQPQIGRQEVPEEIIEIRGSDWRDLLIQYADTAARKMSATKIDTSKNVTGYCSWYYYYFSVSQQQFLDSVRALSNCRRLYNARYAQIDDGYQPAYGDWLSRNERWPDPLPGIVKQLNDLGFVAGIWTMPFLADTQSEVFKKHNDWFVANEDGGPWYIRGWAPEPNQYWACLDVSRPDVQKHLKTTFETLYDWGFRYFKLDGGGFSSPSGIRSREDETGISCLRTGLRLLKEVVKDSVVVGCGVPFVPSIGLVDHTRVSTDTASAWRVWDLPGKPSEYHDPSEHHPPAMPSLCNALRGTLSNWWMYDRWFRADPDVIMARDENSELTAGEARMSALTGVLTGISLTSDRLDKMGDERIRLLKVASQVRMRNVRPRDITNPQDPEVFEGTIDGRKAVAIMNFQNRTRLWALKDLGFENVVKELLHPLGKLDGSVEVGSHDAALLVSVPEN
jgi:alpha-galactosidase